jgi:hypothetical protein
VRYLKRGCSQHKRRKGGDIFCICKFQTSSAFDDKKHRINDMEMWEPEPDTLGINAIESP